MILKTYAVVYADGLGDPVTTAYDSHAKCPGFNPCLVPFLSTLASIHLYVMHIYMSKAIARTRNGLKKPFPFPFNFHSKVSIFYMTRTSFATKRTVPHILHTIYHFTSGIHAR